MSMSDPIVVALVSKPLDALSFEDGGRIAKYFIVPVMGDIRAVKNKVDSKERALVLVRDALAPVTSVRAFAAAHPAFDFIVVEVCLNRLRVPATVATKLADLTAEEGAVIGWQLKPSLLSNTTSNSAVAEWITKFPALQELKEEHEWTEAMFQGIAKELLRRSSMGARFRLYSGAGLSFMDMVTDITMINQYMNTPGQEGYGRALAAMVGLCLGLQLVMVWVQNRKGPKKEMAKEVLIVLFALKPGVDAYRVARGKDQPPYAIIVPEFELAGTKMFEMICEAIPGCVMQLYVILGTLQDGEHVTKQALLSLVVSALSTGFSSATITFDYETNFNNRKDEPEFYGFIPDGTRGTVVFGCMILNSGLLLLARSASAALLIHKESSYFMYYVLGDCAFFFLQKAARGDIHCFFNVDGWAGTFMDFLIQLVFKLIVDYTGLVQFRGPGVLGGSYWTGNMLLALAAPFGAVAIFFASDASTESSLDEGTAWALVSSLCGAWVLIFLIFLLLMTPAYRSTFYTTMTCKEWACSFFTKEGATDATKFQVHCLRRRLWEHLRPEVKEWTLANWARLEREDRDWFMPHRIAQVEDDMIPPDSLEGRKRAEGGRRKSSLSERLLGSSAASSRVTPITS